MAVLAACSIPPQARPADRNPLAPDPVNRQPVGYYEAQLAELPMRVKSYDLTGPMRRRPVVIRELHVLHDDQRDEVLVIDWDNDNHHLWSLDAYDFTLHWKTVMDKRVDFDPLPSRRYIHFMNSDGEYQGYDRMSPPRQGESRLVAKGRFEGDLFPSAHPTSNDAHVFVPATNTNAIRASAVTNNARGEGIESWSFPRPGAGVEQNFMQISSQPAADRETVAFVNNNNYLYMVDAQTGELRASCYLEGHSRTPPVIKDDMVFVGSDMGQVFAWQKSGEAAWTVTVDGLPYGKMFVMNNWVFVRTLEVYEREVTTADGKGKRLQAALRPGMLSAYKYEEVEVVGDRSVFRVVDGDPSTPWKVDPMWSEPDVGQQVLTIAGDRVYMLYERNEEFLSEREKAKLRDLGRIARRSEEMRTVNRELRVLDIKTGQLLRPEWNLNLMDFAFVSGSMEERDPAIYLGTRDGYVFKLHTTSRSAAGGR